MLLSKHRFVSIILKKNRLETNNSGFYREEKKKKKSSIIFITYVLENIGLSCILEFKLSFVYIQREKIYQIFFFFFSLLSFYLSSSSTVQQIRLDILSEFYHYYDCYYQVNFQGGGSVCEN